MHAWPDHSVYDSGNPVFAVIGDRLILLFAKHLGTLHEEIWARFWGPMLSFHLESIQGWIDTWEGDDAGLYQIVPVDLTQFDEAINR